MTRRPKHRSGTATTKSVDDPRQPWLFPKEDLLNDGVIAQRYGDFDGDVPPLSTGRKGRQRMKRPSSMSYPNGRLLDTGLRAVSLAARGSGMEANCITNQAQLYGEFIVAGPSTEGEAA
jgi:hypothetical protein